MLELSTSAGQDRWLAVLLAAFQSASERPMPVTDQMLAESERHLRLNAQANAAGSFLLH